jgi:hypothetical protein
VRIVIADVSDADDACSIELIASDTRLTLFEREGNHEIRLLSEWRGTAATSF